MPSAITPTCISAAKPTSALIDALSESDLDLTGTRSAEITRRYVRAFFDLHLRGEPQHLLDAPSARCPEVVFCAPTPDDDGGRTGVATMLRLR